MAVEYDGGVDRPARFRRNDLLLLLATSALHLVFENVLHAKTPFLAVAVAVWAVYLGWRLQREPGLLRAWGLGTNGLGGGAVACAVIAAAGAVGLYAWARASGRTPLPGDLWVVLGLYAPWALVQQALLNGIVARELAARLPRRGATLAAAALFAVAHAPDPRLMGLTLVAAIAWVSVYLRWPNLWPLTAAHAALGTLAYWCVLGRDPFQELVAPALAAVRAVF